MVLIFMWISIDVWWWWWWWWWWWIPSKRCTKVKFVILYLGIFHSMIKMHCVHVYYKYIKVQFKSQNETLSKKCILAIRLSYFFQYVATKKKKRIWIHFEVHNTFWSWYELCPIVLTTFFEIGVNNKINFGLGMQDSLCSMYKTKFFGIL
jgi:hypothetical protein